VHPLAASTHVLQLALQTLHTFVCWLLGMNWPSGHVSAKECWTLNTLVPGQALHSLADGPVHVPQVLSHGKHTFMPFSVA
jgi:hypothetical protein